MKEDKEFSQNLGFCKPVLVERFGEEAAQAILQETADLYDELKPSIPSFESAGNRLLFKMMVFVLPLYRALLQERSKDEALGITRECFFRSLDAGFQASWVLRTIHRTPSLLRVFRRWFISNVNTADEPDGWKYDKLTLGKGLLYAFSVERCGIHTFFKKQGVPELVRIVCEGDHYVMKYFPKGVRLTRTQTIAECAESCDFHYGFE
jgi:hypothetical protein